MFSTYLRLNLATWASELDVIRAARLKINEQHRRSPTMRKARHEFYRVMLSYHRHARALAAEFRL